MIPDWAKNNKIYDEFNEQQRMIFDLSRQKFLHNIDSFYYVIRCKNEWNKCENVRYFLDFLAMKKDQIESEKIPLREFGEDFFMNGVGYKVFRYDFEKVDKYNVFIANTLPNKDTPSLLVQLRSQFLWLHGEHEAFRQSYDDLVEILSFFKIEIASVAENRIDFAYHTNYIQDFLNFFKEENLNRMQVSRFKRWSKEGYFVGDDNVVCDYISFGRRKSNNLFLRIYNKNQEIVNMQYKQFFIYVWKHNKLISDYDMFVLEECFLNKSYFYESKARLKFYLRYGKDKYYIAECKAILDDTKNKYTSDEIQELADKLTPKVTLICNIEIQTMRKFYLSMQDSIKMFDCVSFQEEELQYISKILDNKHLIHNFLTTNVIRFVDYKAKAKGNEDFTRKRNRPTAPFWRKLQKSKMYQLNTTDIKIIRKYQRNLSEKVVAENICRMVGTWSLYRDVNNKDDLLQDTYDFLMYLNENDLETVHKKHKNKKSPSIKSFFATPDIANLESQN